ncbi:MAG TPA: replication-associated recombination protein A [Gammaproteobacteria bacterium]|nr:replication-associated recombination protein A [Gammaproteobacteria bacterium]
MKPNSNPLEASRLLPLATRRRPSTLQDYCGQTHLLGEGKPLRRAILNGQLHSMILWGPPGTGKTTLAELIATHAKAPFERLSAVFSGVKDIRAVVEKAREARAVSGLPTVLFIDEIHRFNKAQQDVFLPYLEDGTLILIGATTENPSFELNGALLSRARVYVLKSLTEADLQTIIQNALADYPPVVFPAELQATLINAADGDARQCLNLLEILLDAATLEFGQLVITEALLTEVLQTALRRFDKGGEAFHDQISALHKSVRGSSPDAAIYWLCRMLDGGCDPRYLARRIIRMANEDIGLADPRAMEMAVAAAEVYERLGSPEGELALAEVVIYFACAPKSNAVYTAYNATRALVQTQGSHPVPLHLRNAPTKLMKQLDYGKNYRYAHDEPEAYAAGENYFPEALKGTELYHPTERGLEAKIKERLAYFKKRDQQ